MFKMNFYSRYRDEIKKGRRNFRGVITLIFAAGAALILGIGAYMNYVFDLQEQINSQRMFLTSAQVGISRAESESLNAELVEMRNLNADFLARAEELEKNELITTGLFQRIISNMPADVYFQTISLSPQGITASGEAVSRETVAALEYRFKQMEEFTGIFIQMHSNNDGTFNFSLSAFFTNTLTLDTEEEVPPDETEEILEYNEKVSEVISEGEEIYAD